MKTQEDRPRHRLHIPRWGWSMRITTQKMLGGTAYRVFRCGAGFRSDMKGLAPWLLRARGRVFIADATCRPGHVLTIEPLDSVLEQEFILTVGRFFVEA